MSKTISVKSKQAFTKLLSLVRNSSQDNGFDSSELENKINSLSLTVSSNKSAIDDQISVVNQTISGIDQKVDTAVENINQSILGKADVDHNHAGQYAEVDHEHANYATKDDVSAAVDAAVAGAFKFIDSVASMDDLPNSASNGDVYQVGDKEYVMNDSGEWVELGVSVDLSIYAKQAALNTLNDEVSGKASASALASLSDTVALKANISDLNAYVQKIEGKGLSTVDFSQADKSKLDGLENYDDSQLDSRIQDLEDNKADKSELFDKDYDGLSNKPDLTIYAIASDVETELAGKAAADHNHDEVYALVNHSHSDLENSISVINSTIVELQSASSTHLTSDQVSSMIAENDTTNDFQTKIDAKADNSKVIELESVIETLRAEIAQLKAYVNALHNTPDVPIDPEMVEASSNGTPFTSTSEENDIVVSVPMTNTVNVTAPNVVISNDIVQPEPTTSGVVIKSSGTVKVGD